MSQEKVEDKGSKGRTSLFYNTEGDEEADESAKMGTDTEKSSRTEWLASEMQEERPT